jgi:hypothetical protein
MVPTIILITLKLFLTICITSNIIQINRVKQDKESSIIKQVPARLKFENLSHYVLIKVFKLPNVNSVFILHHWSD